METVKLIKDGYTVEVHPSEVKGYMANGWKKPKAVKQKAAGKPKG